MLIEDTHSRSVDLVPLLTRNREEERKGREGTSKSAEAIVCLGACRLSSH